MGVRHVYVSRDVHEVFDLDLTGAAYWTFYQPAKDNLWPNTYDPDCVRWLIKLTRRKHALLTALAGPHGPAILKALKAKHGFSHIPDAYKSKYQE